MFTKNRNFTLNLTKNLSANNPQLAVCFCCHPRGVSVLQRADWSIGPALDSLSLNIRLDQLGGDEAAGWRPHLFALVSLHNNHDSRLAWKSLILKLFLSGGARSFAASHRHSYCGPEVERSSRIPEVAGSILAPPSPQVQLCNPSCSLMAAAG